MRWVRELGWLKKVKFTFINMRDSSGTRPWACRGAERGGGTPGWHRLVASILWPPRGCGEGPTGEVESYEMKLKLPAETLSSQRWGWSGAAIYFFLLLFVMGKICGCSLASKAGSRGLLPGCAPCSSRHKRAQLWGCRACAEASGSGTAAFQLLSVPAFPSLPWRAIWGTP